MDTHTLEPHPPANRPDIHPLSHPEPTRTYPLANPHPEPFLPFDLELGHPPLRLHPRRREMPQHRPTHILHLLRPRPDLHGPVPVLVARLVRHHLVAVELEDGAGCAFAGRRVEEGGHAAFLGEEAGAEGGRVGFSLESGRGCAV